MLLSAKFLLATLLQTSVLLSAPFRVSMLMSRLLCLQVLARAAASSNGTSAADATQRRVVVTGMGVVSCLGHDIDTFYDNLLQVCFFISHEFLIRWLCAEGMERLRRGLALSRSSRPVKRR